MPTQAASVSTLSTGGCGAAALTGSCSLGSRRVSTAGSNPDRCRARLRPHTTLGYFCSFPVQCRQVSSSLFGTTVTYPLWADSLSLSRSTFRKDFSITGRTFRERPRSHLRVEFINYVGVGSNLLVTANTECTQSRADPGSQLPCRVGSAYVVTGLLAARDIVGEVFEAATIRLSTAASRKAFLSSDLSLTLSPSSRDEGYERFWQPRHCCWIVQRPTLLCTHTHDEQ